MVGLVSLAELKPQLNRKNRKTVAKESSYYFPSPTLNHCCFLAVLYPLGDGDCLLNKLILLLLLGICIYFPEYSLSLIFTFTALQNSGRKVSA